VFYNGGIAQLDYNNTTGGAWTFTNNNNYVSFSTQKYIQIYSQNVVVGNATQISFCSTAAGSIVANDTTLFRDAAASVLALGNSVNKTTAAGFRVYNTTDQVASNAAAVNFERAVFDWTSTTNVLSIGTQAGGTGTGRPIRIVGGAAKATALYNFGVAPNTQTANYTVVDGDQWLIFNGSGSITVTLPTAAAYTGRYIAMKTIAAFTVISASSNVVPRTSATVGTAILAAAAGSWAVLISDGTNWVIIAGA
jgi:hypothetical protein